MNSLLSPWSVSADFMVALAEQGDLIRCAVTDAGLTAEQARLQAAFNAP